MDALRLGGYTTLCSTANSPPPAKRRGWEVEIDILSRIDPCGLRRLDDSRHNHHVCDADAAAMIKGPPGLDVGLYLYTAGLAEDCTLGLRHNFCCRCPIPIPRPAMKTRQKTIYRTLDKILKKHFQIFLLVGPGNG